MKIAHIQGRQIIDSRGNPTVEADVILDNDIRGRAAVPSGASTGTNEAVELRDEDPKYFRGKGVQKAVVNVKTEIAELLVGKDVTDQTGLDQAMIDLDGTANKKRLGANAMLAVSLAVAQAAALVKQQTLFAYIHDISQTKEPFSLPMPMMNVINGGQHAAGSTDVQEFMIIPVGAASFSQAVQMGSEIFHSLASVLRKKGYSTTVGDEGGYAPAVKQGNKEALELISLAVEEAGYDLGKDVVFGLDVAASELYKNGSYFLKTEGKRLTTEEMIAWLLSLGQDYPIVSIEDGLAEDDWPGWKTLTAQAGERLQIVGDDLLVTNVSFLKRAIEERAGNAILVKLNQIGTLTETIKAVQLAQQNKWRAIISHRSGETEDTTIAHLVVGLSTGQIKTGSMSRTDRVAKYNELLRIEEILGMEARLAKNVFEIKT